MPKANTNQTVQFNLHDHVEQENALELSRRKSPAKAMRQDVIGAVGEVFGFVKDEVSYQRRSNNRANVANDVEDLVELAERMAIANARLAQLGL